MLSTEFNPISTTPVRSPVFTDRGLTVHVLRLDRLHPIVSGNKWFKLTGYLAQARSKNLTRIVTFGGPYSNHLVATAFACSRQGLASTGIVRGTEPSVLSHSLRTALGHGMQLVFQERRQFDGRTLPATLRQEAGSCLVIPQGGYGLLGARGAEAILAGCPDPAVSHIVCAVGTGTTLAGLIRAARPGQQVLGISVFKNNSGLEALVGALLPEGDGTPDWQICHDYPFRGYGRPTAELIAFMNRWYLETGLPTDFVYTARLFFAAEDLAKRGFFAPGSHLLLIHTGGLQGNDSLPAGTLVF